MKCKIFSPEKNKEFNDIESAVLPGFLGQMQILPGHAEIFSELKEGTLVLTNKTGEKSSLSLSGGVCHVKDDDITIIL